MAVLSVNKFYVFARRGSGIRRIEDLRGKRVAVAPRTGASELFTRIVLRAYDMTYADMHVEFQPFNEMGRLFAEGANDAMIIVSAGTARDIAAPSQPNTPLVLPIADRIITALRAEYPFVKPVVLPPDELPKDSLPVHTVGVDSLLICRKDLDEEIVYQLTREFFSWPETATRYTADLSLAAAAPIPLHPGAARYYREQEILR
jgi:hypothetical protein